MTATARLRAVAAPLRAVWLRWWWLAVLAGLLVVWPPAWLTLAVLGAGAFVVLASIIRTLIDG